MEVKEALNNLISMLLSNDNFLIKQANHDLNQLLKNPDAILGLCEIACSSPEEQKRQYAAVLLNKRIEKLNNWQNVPSEQQLIIRQSIFQALLQEPQKRVRNALSQLIGSMIRHEGERNEWTKEILNHLYERCRSTDPKENELASSIIATLTDAAPDQFVPHLQAICEMFTQVLTAWNNSGNIATPLVANITVAVTYLVPFSLGVQSAEQCLSNSVPLVVQALNGFARNGMSDQFVHAFEFLDSLGEFNSKLISNSFKILLEFSMSLASEKQLDAPVRVQAIAFISRLVRLKKKTIIKQNMLPLILQVLFEVICSEPDAEDDEHFFFGEDNNSPMAASTQTLDTLALYLPAGKLIPPLLQLMESALHSQDPLRRRAAFLSMGVIAEGCADAIRSKYLENMLSIIRQGITDSSIVVRNAAFFTLGQFAEYLQPAISKYASEILPVMFEFLRQLNIDVQNGQNEPKHLDRMFYALDSFCDNLEEDLGPFLPNLMERLFELLDSKHSVHVREVVLSTMASAATSAKEKLQPFFQQTINILQVFLIKTKEDDKIALRTQAIDTLSAIARSVGKDTFKPLADETMKFALSLLDETREDDDPDERRAIYNLIGSLAFVVNEDMGVLFPRIIPRLIKSVLAEDDEIEVANETKNNPENGEEINIEQSDEEDDDDDDDDLLDIGNDYLNEKEEAILTLREFALHTGNPFMQYVKYSFENVYKMLDHAHDSVRKSSVQALVSFIIAIFKQNDIPSASTACNHLIPKLIKMGAEDEESTVVIDILECLGELMRELGHYTFSNDELREQVFELMIDVFNGKTACFQAELFEDEDDQLSEDCETEMDEALVEGAGHILVDFSKTVTPDKFAVYFERFCHLLLVKLQKAKRDDTYEDQRTFVYGVLAECFKELDNMCAAFFNHLCPILIEGMEDVSHLSRQNAYFGIGELVLHAKVASYEAFPAILNALSNALSKETELSAIDNICGAVARLIITNYTLVPLAQVLPALFQKLPLQEDFSENKTIIKCFNVLYTHNRPVVAEHIQQFVTTTIHMLYHNQLTDEKYITVANALIKDIRINYPAEFQAIANSNMQVQEFASKVGVN